MTSWHVYSVEWTKGRIRGYLDGRKWFESRNARHVPDTPASMTVQLDWFPDRTRDRGPASQAVPAQGVVRTTAKPRDQQGLGASACSGSVPAAFRPPVGPSRR